MRYGFHGLSYEYIVSALARDRPGGGKGKIIVLHLGNGASMCAIEAGRSIASTMGFTAVEGLPMGTRSGSLDPGVILHLIDQREMDARAIEKLIYTQSGLLGVSGISSDMRTLLASEDPRAKLAVDLFLYRIRRELGSLAAALGAWTASSLREASAKTRRSSAAASAMMPHGWASRSTKQPTTQRQGASARHRARVAVWVIPTDEESMIARHTLRLLESTKEARHEN